MKFTKLMVALAAMGIATSASALEYDFENNPDGIPGYASVIQVPVKDDGGQLVVDGDGNQVTEPELSFSDGSRARTAEKLGTIIAAYGGTYDFENFPDGVSRFASVIEVPSVDEEGNAVMDGDGNPVMQPALSYASGAKGWRGTSLHNIMTACGLVFDFENVNRVPGYASVRTEEVTNDDGETEVLYQLDLASAGTLWRSVSLHSILSAYVPAPAE